MPLRTGSAAGPATLPCSAFSDAHTAFPVTSPATMPTSETPFPALQAATRKWRKRPSSAKLLPRLMRSSPSGTASMRASERGLGLQWSSAQTTQ
eukprot:6681986-Alexandrium_andersonii.AAC.1